MIQYRLIIKEKAFGNVMNDRIVFTKYKDRKVIIKDSQRHYLPKHHTFEIVKEVVAGKRGKRAIYQEPDELIEKHCYSWEQFKEEVNKLPYEYKDSAILLNEQIKRLADIREEHMNLGYYGRSYKGKRFGYGKYGERFDKGTYIGYLRRKGLKDLVKWHTSIDQTKWDNNLLKYIRQCINGDDVDFFRSKLHQYTKNS